MQYPPYPTPVPPEVEAFIARWSATGGAERANCQPFLIELCTLLGVPPPAGQTGSLGPYRFERTVIRQEPDGRESRRYIDLYKQGCFILEAKQADAAPQPSLLMPEPDRRATTRNTPGWARHMLAARGQAESYARDVPAAEGNPPFLIVCDVGFCFDTYADFSGLGKHYSQFPDRDGFRTHLTDLRDPARSRPPKCLSEIILDAMSRLCVAFKSDSRGLIRLLRKPTRTDLLSALPQHTAVG